MGRRIVVYSARAGPASGGTPHAPPSRNQHLRFPHAGRTSRVADSEQGAKHAAPGSHARDPRINLALSQGVVERAIAIEQDDWLELGTI